MINSKTATCTTATKRFELHRGFSLQMGSEESVNDLHHWQPDHLRSSTPELTISVEEGLLLVQCEPETGSLRRVNEWGDADLALRVVSDNHSDWLGLLTVRDDLLVNGIQALGFTLLTLRDSLTLPGPAGLYYVTAQFKPHVGPPLQEMLGKKCPFCRIAIKSGTYVVSCRCGAIYHAETEETDLDLPDEDRLNCVERIGPCLSCGHEVTHEEFLLWDPEEL